MIDVECAFIQHWCTSRIHFPLFVVQLRLLPVEESCQRPWKTPHLDWLSLNKRCAPVQRVYATLQCNIMSLWRPLCTTTTSLRLCIWCDQICCWSLLCFAFLARCSWSALSLAQAQITRRTLTAVDCFPVLFAQTNYRLLNVRFVTSMVWRTCKSGSAGITRWLSRVSHSLCSACASQCFSLCLWLVVRQWRH